MTTLVTGDNPATSEPGDTSRVYHLDKGDCFDAGPALDRHGEVTVVDSSAVATLLAWRRAATARGAALDFGTLPANLQSLADLYGVSALLQGIAAPTSATDRHH